MNRQPYVRGYRPDDQVKAKADYEAQQAHTAQRIAECRAGCVTEHQMEDVETYSCEKGEYDIVLQRCTRCGQDGMRTTTCQHGGVEALEQIEPSIGTPIVERW
jgi:hypothetical protein